jgi:hypothetical protein
MPTRRLLAVAAAVVFALLPRVAIAADAPDVTGTATVGGAPAAGAFVSVLIDGSDEVWPATTDASGAWGVTAGVEVGQSLTITAMTKVTQTGPDAHGCVTSSSHTGQAKVTVDALPLAPVALTLDTPVTSTVCTATPTPRATPTQAPPAAPTLPATDGVAPSSTGSGTTLTLVIVVGALALGLAVMPQFGRRRRRG